MRRSYLKEFAPTRSTSLSPLRESRSLQELMNLIKLNNLKESITELGAKLAPYIFDEVEE